MPEALFRYAFIALFTALAILRLIYRLRSGLFLERLYARGEPVVFIAARSVLGVPLLAAVFLYIFHPHACSWMYLRLPEPLRLAGFTAGVGSLVLLGWVHRVLDGGFSTGPAPRPGRPLVREGPYAWVRHPMYLSYFLLFSGAFLLSANWVIGVSGLAIIGLLMTLRLAREERLLVERYGTEYRQYRESTGRFLPFRRLSRTYPFRRTSASADAHAAPRPSSSFRRTGGLSGSGAP